MDYGLFTEELKVAHVRKSYQSPFLLQEPAANAPSPTSLARGNSPVKQETVSPTLFHKTYKKDERVLKRHLQGTNIQIQTSQLETNPYALWPENNPAHSDSITKSSPVVIDEAKFRKAAAGLLLRSQFIAKESLHGDSPQYRLDCRESSSLNWWYDARNGYHKLVAFGGIGAGTHKELMITEERSKIWQHKTLWSATLPTNFGLFEHTAVVYFSTLLIYGGLIKYDDSPNPRLNGDVFAIDLDTAQISKLAIKKELPCPRRLHASVCINSFLIVIGGIGEKGEKSTANVWMYSLSSTSLTQNS